MNDQQIRQTILNKLRQKLSESLGRDGFDYTIKASWTGKYIEDSWTKNRGWQKSEVRTLLNPNLNDLSISFNIFLNTEEDNILQFDGTTLDYLMEKKSAYRLPKNKFGFLISNRIDRFINIINNDISQNLVWFDNFKDPIKCLSILENEKQKGIQNRNGFGISKVEKAILLLKKAQDMP